MTAATPYETDFYQWTQQQAALIRQGQFSELDTAHLIDEIEDMGTNLEFRGRNGTKQAAFRRIETRT